MLNPNPPRLLPLCRITLGARTNASSSMGVAEHNKRTFLELQRKKVFRYVIFKIDEVKKEVVVEKTGGPAESYDDFTGRLMVLDETNKRDVVFPDGFTIPNVSEDIRCDKGDRIRYKFDVLEFNQLAPVGEMPQFKTPSSSARVLTRRHRRSHRRPQTHHNEASSSLNDEQPQQV